MDGNGRWARKRGLSRPRAEVTALFNLLATRINREAHAFHQENIRLLHLGDADKLSRKLGEKITAAVKLTRHNTGLTLCLAIDYGGRDEIIQAARDIISSNITADKVDQALFSQYLYTHDIPDPDLVIRTGGELRLSNFLLWQAAYSELYFTPVLWPDFGQKEIEEAFKQYKCRQRRFGNI